MKHIFEKFSGFLLILENEDLIWLSTIFWDRGRIERYQNTYRGIVLEHLVLMKLQKPGKFIDLPFLFADLENVTHHEIPNFWRICSLV